jgi:hypothetical protein
MREETRPRRPALAELAAAQHGVVSSWQLGELRYTTSAIDRELTTDAFTGSTEARTP